MLEAALLAATTIILQALHRLLMQGKHEFAVRAVEVQCSDALALLLQYSSVDYRVGTMFQL